MAKDDEPDPALRKHEKREWMAADVIAAAGWVVVIGALVLIVVGIVWGILFPAY